MHLFRFEPGDGTSYRILFGRLPAPTPLIPFYTLFGFAEGYDALIVYPFDTERVSYETFERHIDSATHRSTVNEPDQLIWRAYQVYKALVGIRGEGVMGAVPGWRDDWRDLLPTAALG
jgi:hypothetical protein